VKSLEAECGAGYTSAPRLAKSAERIEGATITSDLFDLSTLLVAWQCSLERGERLDRGCDAQRSLDEDTKDDIMEIEMFIMND